MKETMKEKLELLQAEFPPEDIEWRIARSGKTDKGIWAMIFPYLTARAVTDRLTEVFGLDGWRNEFRELILPGKEPGIICRISFKGSDGEWCWREDGAPLTEYEPFKGGLSGAKKRAASGLDIGRYLYRIPEKFAIIGTKHTDATPFYQKANPKANTPMPAFYWGVPANGGSKPEDPNPQVDEPEEEEEVTF